MRKYLYLISLSLCLICGEASAQTLQQRLDTIMAEVERESYFTGMAVYDLTADSMLYTYNAHKRMRPASTQKVLTAVAALDVLGGQYKFETKAYVAGLIDIDSTLYGDIYVQGGFDPAYSYMDLRMLAKSIKDRGINKIMGRVIGDVSMKDTLTMGSGWCWDDVPSEVEAYLCPLTFNRGCATVESDMGRLKFSVPTSYMTLTDSTTLLVGRRTGARIRLSRNWVDNGNHFIARGTRRQGTVSQPISVYRPERYFVCTLADELGSIGVRFLNSDGTDVHVSADRYAIATLPDTVQQPFYIGASDMSIVLQQMMKDSDNLYAEAMFYQLAHHEAGKWATGKDGAKQVETMMKRAGVSSDDYRIADGSGVSLYNYVTASAQVAVLRYAYHNEQIFQYLYRSLPIAGLDGTLETRMTASSIRHKVRAKTGTVSGVSCLSGYCEAANGHTLAFVIMNNGQRRAALARTLQDRLCQEMVR